jgi:membrane protein YqaA with SNARE-associated domain
MNAASFGAYGGAALSSLLFGFIPGNPDIPLFAISATLVDDPWVQLPIIVAISAVLHTLAKVATYYMGVGILALPHRRPRWRPMIERAQRQLDRWNRHPYWILAAAAVIGLPPLYLVGFIASALRVRIVPFILIVLLGRLVHFGVVAALPWIDYSSFAFVARI